MAESSQIFWIKILTVVCAICVWEGLARSGLFFEGVVPPTLAVVNAIGREFTDKGFYRDLGVTLLESGLGFLWGSLIGISLGIVLGLNSFFRRMMEPIITAIGGTPKIVFLPILFLIFGLGLESKIAKAALSTFFPVVLSTTSGFLLIPNILLRVGKSFHLSRWQTIVKVYVPAMAHPLLTGLRLGMAMAIIGVLSAEITYSDMGLGYRLIRNADQFQIASVYALAIIIFAVAATVNFAMTILQARVGRHERRNDEFVTAKTVPAPAPRSEVLGKGHA
jgi:ABC-type nitrate/sulfonate/bicarbonate transport system permease component